jgi:DNA modification methylase
MTIRVIHGDCRAILPTLAENSIHCVVTSPPYFGLRDYGEAGQIGLESTPAEYVAEMVAVFREVRRALRDDGTLWLNLGDTYASNWPCNRRNVIGTGSLADGKRANRPPRMGGDLKDKDLIGIPWMVAFALRADGWYLRSDIIWAKPNPMPESVTDRPTSAHEHVFLLTKSPRYFYDAEAVREPAEQPDRVRADRFGGSSWEDRQQHSVGFVFTGSETRNARNVWNIATAPFPGSHFATMPPDLAERCIKAGCPAGGTVLDPFGGAGTTGLVADRLGRNAVLIEINAEYGGMARDRVVADAPLFAEVLS